jgi:hypothetical protein
MQFTPEADEAFFEGVRRYVQRVRAECQDMSAYFMAENLADRSDGLTHGILGSFTDSAAHDAYQVSPVHQEMKAYMSPFIHRIVVLDAEDGA